MDPGRWSSPGTVGDSIDNTRAYRASARGRARSDRAVRHARGAAGARRRGLQQALSRGLLDTPATRGRAVSWRGSGSTCRGIRGRGAALSRPSREGRSLTSPGWVPNAGDGVRADRGPISKDYALITTGRRPRAGRELLRRAFRASAARRAVGDAGGIAGISFADQPQPARVTSRSRPSRGRTTCSASGDQRVDGGPGLEETMALLRRC